MGVSGAFVVAVLTRAPSAGGKSRLFAALGCAHDPRLCAALLLDTVDAAALDAATRVVYTTPPESVEEVRALLPPDVAVRPQASGDLGARMAGVFVDLLAGGAAAVAVIGSDLPELPAQALSLARAALVRDPDAVVIGPADDGGYYLIAACRTPAVLCDAVAWGGTDVLAVTLARARAAGLRIVFAPPGADIDSPADLRRLVASAAPAPRTRAWIAAHAPIPGATPL